MTLQEIFTSRELAAAIWIAVGLVAGLAARRVRKAIFGVLRAFFRLRPLTWLATIAIYSAGMVLLLNQFGLWNLGLLKDTVLWFILTAAVVSIREVNLQGASHTFKAIMIDSIGVVAIIEYLSNTYTFSLPVELILLPAAGFIAAINAVANSDRKYFLIKRITSYTLALLGIAVMGASTYKAFTDPQILSADSLRSFLLAPVMSFVVSPLLLLMSTYAKYEVEFARINILMKKDTDLGRYTKKRFIRRFGFRINRLDQFMRVHSVDLMSIGSQREIEWLISKSLAEMR